MTTEKGRGKALSLVPPYVIMSVDLGETTGVAICYFDVGYHTLRCSSTKEHLVLSPILELIAVDELLLERIPVNHSLEFYLAATYNQLAMQSIMISPSEWKPFMQSRKKDLPQLKNQHEKDALNMLRYHLIISYDKDIV